MEKMKPNFIGLGSQKCATAWLYNMLNSHPNISMVVGEDGDKDTKFFSYFYDRGFEWYEKHFHNLMGNNILGEFSTSYFYNSHAPKRIFDYSPDIKLIVSLRNPIERAFSNHKHEIKLGRISGENLFFENGLKNNPMYVYQSLYYTHLSRWFRYFDKTQIFIIMVDDLRCNPSKIIRELYAFLGVDTAHKPAMLGQRIHETHIPQNTLFEQAIKKTSAFVKSIGGARLVDYLKSRGVNRKVYRLNSRAESDAFPPMKEATRILLLQKFAQENKKLAELINRDLSSWNQ